MKKFEIPEVTITMFVASDIIAASNELPFEPLSLVLEDEMEIAAIGNP